MSAVNRNALFRLVAGFTVWSAGFVFLYALQALGCAYGWSAHRLILIVGYGITLLPLVWLALWGGGETTTLAVSAKWANRAALASGILVFFPVTFASLCA
jgi:hypothetical protein